jgi:hypothetical protein
LRSGFRCSAVNTTQSGMSTLWTSCFPVALNFSEFAGITGSRDSPLKLHLWHGVFFRWAGEESQPKNGGDAENERAIPFWEVLRWIRESSISHMTQREHERSFPLRSCPGDRATSAPPVMSPSNLTWRDPRDISYLGLTQSAQKEGEESWFLIILIVVWLTVHPHSEEYIKGQRGGEVVQLWNAGDRDRGKYSLRNCLLLLG